jgi:hypothetical protein
MVRALRLTRWDALVFGRAVGAAAGTLLLAWLVTAVTDEGGVPWGERLGRTLPLAPLCAALGTAAALAPVRWRGESGALASLGRSRAEIAAAAVLGGTLVACAAAVLTALVGRVDVSGFYPTATHASAWRWNGAAFVDGVRGLRVAADGMPARIDVEAGAVLASLPPHARGSAALTTAVAGLALPMLLAHAMLASVHGVRLDRAGSRIAGAAALSIAASVFLFQAAAARQLPALLAVLPALALLGLAAWRYRVAP